MAVERTQHPGEAEPSMSMVSIIVNNFNYAKFLPQCIDSALAQTYPRVEVIVVDDASTDNSAELIRGFGSRIAPLLQAVNGGQAAAMNAGFAASSGDVIIFLDADDYLYPQAAEQVAKLYREGVALVQYRLHLVDVQGAVIDQYPPAEIRFDAGDVTRKLVATGRIEGTVTSGLAFSRSALAAVLPIPEDRYRIAADGYLVTTAPLQGDVLAIDQPLGAYRRHGSNSWMSSSNAADGFRRSIVHDAEKHLDLKRHAALRGIHVPDDPGLRDYQHLSARLGSMLLAKDKHPRPDDSRLALGLRGVPASIRASIPVPLRLLLAAWYLGLGALPESWSRKLFLWRFEPSSRPQGVRSLLRALRQRVRA
jgi:Glycosyl transferase family 2